MQKVERDVEVVGTSHAVGALDGASLTAVAFGTIGKPAAVAVGSPIPPGSSVAAIWAVVFVSPEMNSRFYMGSKWHLKIGPNGTTSIEPIRAGPVRRAKPRRTKKA